MARTRAQIKTFVDYHTGRGTEKATLIELYCDEALRVAIQEHPFEDSRAYAQDTAITADATTVSISAITNIMHVISATIIDSTNSRSAELILKDETWWTENVVNASDNQKGWPLYGLRRGTDVLLDRPADSGLTLRLVVSQNQTFTNDATVCPIGLLDVFVTQYVTSMIFHSINEHEKAKEWYIMAMGAQYSINGKVGGSLGQAIEQDKKDRAVKMKAQRGRVAEQTAQQAVQNLITGHSDYGNVRLWGN